MTIEKWYHQGILYKTCLENISTLLRLSYSFQHSATELNTHFFKEDTKVSSQHMKRCLESFVIREMQTKHTMQFKQISIIIARAKRTNNEDREVEKFEPSHIVDGNVKWEKSYFKIQYFGAQNLQACVLTKFVHGCTRKQSLQ